MKVQAAWWLVSGLLAGTAAMAQPHSQAHPQVDCAAPLPGMQVLRESGVQVQWRVLPGITLGKPFALDILVCPATAELLRVDATMPEHRHGMNYRPSLTPLGAGRWRAEGLLWHMSGRWELQLDLKHAGQDLRLRQPVTLP